jgi:hypothetical protein
MTALAPETSWGLFSVDPNVAETLAVVTLHNASLGYVVSTLIITLERLMRSVTSASVSRSQETREIRLLMDLQVRGKSEVLRTVINWDMSDNCFDRVFSVLVTGEIMEICGKGKSR